MKLYKVEVTVEMVVLAEDEFDAEIVAQENLRDALDNSIDVYAHEIIDEKDLPPGWDLKCLAWGDSSEKTIGEWLNLPNNSLQE